MLYTSVYQAVVYATTVEDSISYFAKNANGSYYERHKGVQALCADVLIEGNKRCDEYLSETNAVVVPATGDLLSMNQPLIQPKLYAILLCNAMDSEQVASGVCKGLFVLFPVASAFCCAIPLTNEAERTRLTAKRKKPPYF